ncbi:MAG: tRNA (guanosine(46)-N7)-methyltransferase TrmB [Bacteroidota bacterium]|nr:tRNA (guanosine(46)-N7)-methyltransferase TrmB [Bacteroidota bacterium]
MGKDKLKRFNENETFQNLYQPTLQYNSEQSELKGNWSEEFQNDNNIILELGCGRGEYTTSLASRNQDKNYIGVDIKGARLWRGAKTALENKLTNVRFLRTKVDFITKFFESGEVNEIWLTFSDPQPKKPRKRLTSPLFIERYKKILNQKGIIHLKTDSQLLYEYTHEQIQLHRYKILHDIKNIDAISEKINQDLKETLSYRTFYEEKWLKDGIKIKYLSFSINS